MMGAGEDWKGGPPVVSQSFWIALVVWLSALVADCSFTYYVDCAGGSDAATGLSPDTALRSLERVNELALRPGDQILLKRGVTCRGSLHPAGSGRPDAPIRVGAFGEGPLPAIDASGEAAAILLWDQEGFEIGSLELFGSSPFGIYVGAPYRTLRHLRLHDLRVHSVPGELTTKSSGLVVLAAEGAGGRFEDVVIDGVTASGTTQWAGILVWGRAWDAPTPRSSNVTIRNSLVHDVYGDGIVLFEAHESVIETSVAYATGQQPQLSVGTPNGIWTWACSRCTVQYNEGFATSSPAHDGGVFDIDWASSDNVVQYNYGHDADGYCVGVFGARQPTTNSIVRYNVCANNGRDPARAYQGEVFLTTWDGGTLDGVRIYNNTFYWTPARSAPLLRHTGLLAPGSEAFFWNNLVYTTSDWIVDDAGGLALDHNLYWTPARVGPGIFRHQGVDHEGLPAWQEATGQDAHSLWADPVLLDPGETASGWRSADSFRLGAASPAIDAGAWIEDGGGCDHFGGAVGGSAPDIGAHEFGAEADAACDG
jgi:hypothetical protein